MENQIDYQALNQEVETQTKKIKNFLRGTYLIISTGMFGLFGLISLTSGQPETAAGMMSMGWLTTLIFYWISGLADFGIMDKAIKQQALQRAMNKQMLANMQAAMEYGAEKPKRDGAVERLSDQSGEEHVMEISDDGELIPAKRRVDENK